MMSKPISKPTQISLIHSINQNLHHLKINVSMQQRGKIGNILDPPTIIPDAKYPIIMITFSRSNSERESIAA